MYIWNFVFKFGERCDLQFFLNDATADRRVDCLTISDIFRGAHFIVLSLNLFLYCILQKSRLKKWKLNRALSHQHSPQESQIAVSKVQNLFRDRLINSSIAQNPKTITLGSARRALLPDLEHYILESFLVPQDWESLYFASKSSADAVIRILRNLRRLCDTESVRDALFGGEQPTTLALIGNTVVRCSRFAR